MRIILTNGSFYPAQTGGPSNTLYWHAKALQQRQQQVVVLTTKEGIDNTKHQITADEWTDRGFGRIKYCSNHVKALWSTLRQLHKEDILHLSSLFYYPAFLAAIYCYVKGQRWIWSPRGECAPQALIYSSWKKKPLLAILRKISHKAIFHATSPKETAEIKQVFGNDTQVIEFPNYCYLEEKLDVPVEKQLLFVGRIHPIKAIENLIEAVSLSDAFQQEGFVLKIVGKHDGQQEYFDKLQQLVKDLQLQGKVIFAGHQAGAAKLQLFAASYALVLPSHTENFGNVVIEALNQGTPVIASANTPWELLPATGAGLHVSNAPASLAAAIDTLIQQSLAAYQQMRQRAFQLCEDQFSIEKNIDKWIGIYDNMKHNS